MKRYERAMTHCVPPADLEQRLAQRIQTSAPAVNVRVIRPASLARRALLAAVLLAVLSVSVGAAVLVNWDGIFADRFGEDAAGLPVTQTAFQSVDVTGVCDDVTLTIREALGDSKTLYLILDYRLNDAAARKLAQTYWDSDSADKRMIGVGYYGTGDWNWEALKSAEAALWQELDWADMGDRNAYLRESVLAHRQFGGGGSSLLEERSYDPETGTLTYLLRFRTDSQAQTLQDQPLTLLVLPPVAAVGEERIPLAEQPALISFQPEYTAAVRSGEVETEDNACRIRAEVSPFTIGIDYYGSAYGSLEALRGNVQLVLQDGSVLPVQSIGEGYSGSQSFSEAAGKTALCFRSHFREILAVETVEAVQIGEIRIPLS